MPSGGQNVRGEEGIMLVGVEHLGDHEVRIGRFVDRDRRNVGLLTAIPYRRYRGFVLFQYARTIPPSAMLTVAANAAVPVWLVRSVPLELRLGAEIVGRCLGRARQRSSAPPTTRRGCFRRKWMGVCWGFQVGGRHVYGYGRWCAPRP